MAVKTTSPTARPAAPFDSAASSRPHRPGRIDMVQQIERAASTRPD
jgi:hypothetical protein